MNFDDARIIVSTPNDGHVDPSSVVTTMSQIASSKGSTISRFNRVLEINRTKGEWEVITENGTIKAEHVVNAGGCFAPEVGAMVGGCAHYQFRASVFNYRKSPCTSRA